MTLQGSNVATFVVRNEAICWDEVQSLQSPSFSVSLWQPVIEPEHPCLAPSAMALVDRQHTQ